jgi:thymidylate kinase
MTTVSSSSLVLVTELNPEVDEGMAVTVRGLLAGGAGLGLDVRLLQPPEAAGRVASRAFVAWAASRLRSFPPSVVVLYVPRAGLTRASAIKGAFLARVAKRSIAQVILQADATQVPRLSHGVVYVVLSDALAAALRDRGGTVVTVRLGIDERRFNTSGRADASLWPEGGGARILHVGHMKRERNVGALADLARRGHSCLLIASPATAPDDRLAQELREAGVAVVRRHIADLAAVYRAADVYLFPVDDPRACTTMPLSVLEALACGTPVVATPFGAVGEVFAHTPAVRLAESHELVSAVEEVVESASAIPESLTGSWETTVRDVVRAVAQCPPKLILLLGLDGTGKSTQTRLLLECARARGIRAESIWARWDPLLLAPLLRLRRRAATGTSEPDGDAYVAWKRRLFRHAIVRELWRRLAAADHFLRVGPTLIRGLRRSDLVICDRYYHDALIDMAVGFGGGPPAPVGMHRLFPQPDITLLLDGNVEMLTHRAQDSPSFEYLSARRGLYVEMATRNGWPVIDATRPVSEVQKEVASHIWP